MRHQKNHSASQETVLRCMKYILVKTRKQKSLAWLQQSWSKTSQKKKDRVNAFLKKDSFFYSASKAK